MASMLSILELILSMFGLFPLDGAFRLGFVLVFWILRTSGISAAWGCSKETFGRWLAAALVARFLEGGERFVSLFVAGGLREVNAKNLFVFAVFYPGTWMTVGKILSFFSRWKRFGNLVGLVAGFVGLVGLMGLGFRRFWRD